jgi:hypothetical protein
MILPSLEPSSSFLYLYPKPICGNLVTSHRGVNNFLAKPTCAKDFLSYDGS